MKMKSIIVQGSARSEGNTNTIAQLVQSGLEADVIDLNTKQIHGFSYTFDHQGDDFLPVMREIVKYDTIIFMTPVYWYAMSGLMKNFFDRITDCLKVEKELGRQLKGKNMAAVACGSDSTEAAGFFVPFRNSAAYLGMHYCGDVHTWMATPTPETKVVKQINTFVNNVKQSAIVNEK